MMTCKLMPNCRQDFYIPSTFLKQANSVVVFINGKLKHFICKYNYLSATALPALVFDASKYFHRSLFLHLSSFHLINSNKVVATFIYHASRAILGCRVSNKTSFTLILPVNAGKIAEKSQSRKDSKQIRVPAAG